MEALAILPLFVILPCAKCGADVPEGANSCPQCGASLASIVLSKERRGLTKTLIGKAIELRQSIPWANPSAVLLLDDPRRPGKKKVRTGARNTFVVLLLAAVAGGALYIWRNPTRQVDVYEVMVTPPAVTTPKVEKPVVEKIVEKPVVAEKPSPPAPAPVPVAQKAAAPAPAPAPAPTPAAAAKGSGTLVVTALFKGKPVKDAAVHLNGVKLGSTPVKAPVQPGKYTLKIEKAGFKTEKRPDVDVRAGKTQTVTIELKKS